MKNLKKHTYRIIYIGENGKKMTKYIMALQPADAFDIFIERFGKKKVISTKMYV